VALWRGWVPSVIGVVPYVGLNFAVYETLKEVVLDHYGEDRLPVIPPTPPLPFIFRPPPLLARVTCSIYHSPTVLYRTLWLAITDRREGRCSPSPNGLPRCGSAGGFVGTGTHIHPRSSEGANMGVLASPRPSPLLASVTQLTISSMVEGGVCVCGSRIGHSQNSQQQCI